MLTTDHTTTTTTSTTTAADVRDFVVSPGDADWDALRRTFNLLQLAVALSAWGERQSSPWRCPSL
jgi:hypothetical protein